MIRKSTISLKFANTGKLAKIKEIAEEYQKVVNLFIDSLWKQQQFSGSFVKDTSIESWLSARLKQAAAKQAVNHFDIWIKLSSIGNKIIINLPSQKHFHFNHFLKDGWAVKKSIRLRITEQGCFVDIFFEKKAPAIKTSGKQKAIDIGYKKLIVSSDGEFIGDSAIYGKISRKKQGSKAFKRALIERDEIVNSSCKALDLDNVKELFVEDLKNVKHKSKGKIRKKFNNKLQRWTYRDVLGKLTMLCEESGILFKKIPPQYTSQRCSSCGAICKSNRNGEIYKCACGNIMDADYNASLNILHVGTYGSHALQPVL